MKCRILFLLLLSMADAYAQAESQDVYMCVDEKGQREYKNFGNFKGCKKIDLPPLTTVAIPKRAPNAASGNAASKTTASSPPEFPKVDEGTQKARDNDRRQILQDELRTEEQKLATLKREFQGGEPERHGNEANFAKYQERVNQMRDDITRVEKNIEALKRELANIK